MIRIITASFIGISVGCTTQIPQPQQPVGVEVNPDGAWQSVLSKHVDSQGKVDFRAAEKSAGALQSYVHWLGSHGPKTTPELFSTADDRLAYYINTYNAVAMYGVIKKGYPKDLDGFFKRLGFFVLTSYKIDGEFVSLYDYENELIRKLGDPRIHFALNCMSIGCPRLPQVPYEGVKLQEQLNEGAVEFFNSPKYAYTDDEAKVAYISEILDFFTEDFVNAQQAPNLIAYVNRYRKQKIPESYEVKFIPYDWTLNYQ